MKARAGYAGQSRSHVVGGGVATGFGAPLTNTLLTSCEKQKSSSHSGRSQRCRSAPYLAYSQPSVSGSRNYLLGLLNHLERREPRRKSGLIGN